MFYYFTYLFIGVFVSMLFVYFKKIIYKFLQTKPFKSNFKQVYCLYNMGFKISYGAHCEINKRE